MFPPSFVQDSFKLDRDIRTGLTDIAQVYVCCYGCFEGTKEYTFTSFIIICDNIYSRILIASSEKKPSKKICKHVLKELKNENND